jgi:hypothetical protein
MIKNILTKIYLTFLGSCILSGCASGYRAIKSDEILDYTSNQNPCLKYSYRYGILSASENNRYAKIASKHTIKVVAIELTNLTNKEINFNEISIKAGSNEILLMGPEITAGIIHQKALKYFWWSLLFVYSENNNGLSFYPIGIPIAIGNMIAVQIANEKFFDDLKKNDLSISTIEPGETKFGIISFYSSTSEPINITIKNIGDNSTLDSTTTKHLIESTNDNHPINLLSVLFMTDSDSGYQNYIDRIVSILQLDQKIISYDLTEKKYANGKIKSRGIESKHRYGVNEDYSYKIGTWEYYNDTGILEKTVNYDLREKIVK